MTVKQQLSSYNFHRYLAKHVVFDWHIVLDGACSEMSLIFRLADLEKMNMCTKLSFYYCPIGHYPNIVLSLSKSVKICLVSMLRPVLYIDGNIVMVLTSNASRVMSSVEAQTFQTILIHFMVLIYPHIWGYIKTIKWYTLELEKRFSILKNVL